MSKIEILDDVIEILIKQVLLEESNSNDERSVPQWIKN